MLKGMALAICAVLALGVAGCAKERQSQPDAGGPPASNDSSGDYGRGGGGDKNKNKENGQQQGGGAQAQVIRVKVSGDRVTGAKDPTVSVGETVEIVVEAATRDEVHVHGYDLTKAVKPNRAARLRFVADIPGVFEVELEGSGKLLFELTVE